MNYFQGWLSNHRFLLVLATCLGLLAAASYEIKAFQGWQQDLAVQFISRPNADDIRIISIDERSLAKLGRWPWSRSIHAQLIDQLTEAKVKAIAMDIFFIEPEQDNPKADDYLAKAIHRNGKVVLPVILDETGTDSLQMQMPLKPLAQAANLGFVNMHLSTDGVFRGLYLQAESADMKIYSLAQTLLDITKPSYPASFRHPPEHIQQHFQMRDYRMIMSFPKAEQGFTQLSYWDVLNDAALRKTLTGKFVLIGMTATGLATRFTAPSLLNPTMMSGVEVNANILLALQSGLAIKPLPSTWGMLISFCLAFIPVILFGLLSLVKRLLCLGLFTLSSLALSLIIFKTLALWYAPLTAVFIQLLSYPVWAWYHQKRLAQNLLHEKEQATIMLYAIGDAVITTDPQGKVQFMNPVAELITGYSLSQAHGQAIENVVSLKKDKRGDIFSAIYQFLASDKPEITTKPLSLMSKDNQKYAVRITAKAMRNATGVIDSIIFALSDITEIIEVGRKMKHLATHDALTQLPNRTLLEDRLSSAINMGERHLRRFAVIFIDLDGFKKINDTQGHQTGDLLLKEVAARLSAQKRKTDTIARWGGDEFVILLENISSEAVVVDIAREIINTLCKPFKIAGQELLISPSMGISLYPKDGHHGSELLEKADTAMYQVKKSGRNNFCFYHEKLNHAVF